MTGGAEQLHPGILFSRGKQRLLNSLGRRTTYTKNPDVDFISGRLEEIRCIRKQMTQLLQTYQDQLHKLLSTKRKIETFFLSCWKKEIGERVYVKDLDSYARLKSSSERGFTKDIFQCFGFYEDTINTAEKKFDDYLIGLVKKGKWLENSRDGDSGDDDGGAGGGEDSGDGSGGRVSGVDEERKMKGCLEKAKREYSSARTAYSDAMLMYRGRRNSNENENHHHHNSNHTDDNNLTNSHVHPTLTSAKMRYDVATSKLLEASAGYERIYREGLIRRASRYFKEERMFLRALSDSLDDIAPITDTFSTNLEDMSEDIINKTGSSSRRNMTHGTIRMAATKFSGNRYSDVSDGSSLPDRRSSDHLTKAFSFGSDGTGGIVGSIQSGFAAAPDLVHDQNHSTDGDKDMKVGQDEPSEKNTVAESTPNSNNNSESNITQVIKGEKVKRRTDRSVPSESSSGSLAFHEGRNRIELVRRDGWNKPMWNGDLNKSPSKRYREIHDHGGTEDDAKSEESVVRVDDLERIML